MNLSASLLKTAKKRSAWPRAMGALMGAGAGLMAGPKIMDRLAARGLSSYFAKENGFKLPSGVAGAVVGARDTLNKLAPPDSQQYVPLYNAARIALPAIAGAGLGYAGGAALDR